MHEVKRSCNITQFKSPSDNPTITAMISAVHFLNKLGLNLNTQISTQMNNNQNLVGVTGLYTQVECWFCGKVGHKKLNCPQLTCFFCNKPGHCKKVCLNYRLAKMFDDEKNLSNTFSSPNTTQCLGSKFNLTVNSDVIGNGTTSTTGVTPPRDSDLLHVPEIDKKEKYVNLNNSRCANPPIKTDDAPIKTQRPENLNQPKNQVDTLIEQNFIHHIEPRKTCIKCPKCSSLFLTRKNALSHFEKKSSPQ